MPPAPKKSVQVLLLTQKAEVKEIALNTAPDGSISLAMIQALMKKKVAADQKWACGHCHQTLDESYEVDHKLALFQGGTNELENLIALCRNCHGKKTMQERLKSA
jgi:cytochrome c553